ncbi:MULTISPECIES: hypothetical protein [Hungatella]|nr:MULTISPECIES: hypothetical protein [Hungatella]
MEMTVWIEEYHSLIAAEIATHTLHNRLTPRGAEVLDARLWWKALDNAQAGHCEACTWRNMYLLGV